MSKFVGTWIALNVTGDLSETDMYTFYKGGACIYTSLKALGTYTVENGKLVVTLRTGIERTYDYVFSDNNTKLTLTLVGGNQPDIVVGSSTLYIKQQ